MELSRRIRVCLWLKVESNMVRKPGLSSENTTGKFSGLEIIGCGRSGSRLKNGP